MTRYSSIICIIGSISFAVLPVSAASAMATFYVDGASATSVLLNLVQVSSNDFSHFAEIDPRLIAATKKVPVSNTPEVMSAALDRLLHGASPVETTDISLLVAREETRPSHSDNGGPVSEPEIGLPLYAQLVDETLTITAADLSSTSASGGFSGTLELTSLVVSGSAEAMASLASDVDAPIEFDTADSTGDGFENGDVRYDDREVQDALTPRPVHIKNNQSPSGFYRL
jgi:hypothetical protein